MTGRPRPTALKVLNGSAAHHPERRNPDEPTPDPLVAVPEPPYPLTGRARTAWNDLAPQAIAMRTLTGADLYALAETCQAFAKARATGRADWHKAFMSGLGAFGFYPAARPRIHAAPKANDDDFAALLRPLGRRSG